MIIVTHSSRFHADDVFALATLLSLFPDATVIRSRDPEKIATGDIVVDIGNAYDPAHKRFDHHQAGGAGVRPNGIPYASFGLVWKEYGAKLAGSEALADAIDRMLVQGIDAMDNGIDLVKEFARTDVRPYIFQNIVFQFGSTWKEGDQGQDQRFLELVQFAKRLIEREIIQARDFAEAESLVIATYESAKDKRIIILDKKYPYQSILVNYPEPLYVVCPNLQDATWKVECVLKKLFSYDKRKPLPAAWAGKRDLELAKVTGVSDAVFCHNGRFMAVTQSKEGALKLAKLALESET